MIYREYQVAEMLKPYIKVIWSMESDDSMPGTLPICILPDSCVELVFHFGDPYTTHFSNGTNSVQKQSMVIAQMKNPIKIQATGKTGMIAVRFPAFGAYRFFGIPMKEISNQETGLSEIWADIATEMEEKIYVAKSTQERSQLIQDYLYILLLKNGVTDKGVDYCIHEIRKAHGQVLVGQLADQVGLSNRQLIRRFDKCIGLSPKEFIRITKFIHTLDLLNQLKNPSLTDVALFSGYYDQAHFIHDFREFSGMTPTSYLASSNVVY